MAIVFVLTGFALFFLILVTQQGSATRHRGRVADIDAARRAHGVAGEQSIGQVLAKSGRPYLSEVYLQSHDGKHSRELDFVVACGRELLIIEVKAWSGHTTGRARDALWSTEKRSAGGKVYRTERSNPLKQTTGHFRALQHFARSHNLKGFHCHTYTVVAFGTVEIADSRYVIDVAGLERLLRARGPARLDRITGALWTKLQRSDRRANKRAAKQHHLAVVRQRQCA